MFWSPVRSRALDRDQDWSTFSKKGKKPDQDRSFLKKILWVGRYITVLRNFNLSPRTLIYVKNWWSYKNIRILYFFRSIFTILEISLSVLVWLIWSLACLKVFSALQKTGLFVVFRFQKSKTGPKKRPNCGLGPVQLRSFCGPGTGLTNTNPRVRLQSIIHKCIKIKDKV